MLYSSFFQGGIALGNKPARGNTTVGGSGERREALSRCLIPESRRLGAVDDSRRDDQRAARSHFLVAGASPPRSATPARTGLAARQWRCPGRGSADSTDAIATRPSRHGRRVVRYNRHRLMMSESVRSPDAFPRQRAVPVVPTGFRLPGSRDRLMVLGRTGSGKSHFAAWVLSHANWNRVPWIIIDYKFDPLIKQIPQLEEIRLEGKLPKHPGVYVVHPRPDQEAEVEALLWKLWEKERVGLWVDEGHILPDGGSLQALLSQGRSKSIPVILLSQRPVWLNRFALSESGYFSVFSMNDRRDRKTIESFLPGISLEEKLPVRHSYYYDVSNDRAFLMKPVPGKDDILNRFVDRNPRHNRWKAI